MKGTGAKRNVCSGSCVSTGAKFPVAPVESAPMATRVRCAACLFNIRSRTRRRGEFTSPNYPGFYPRNVRCHYIFYGRQHERVHITLLDFNVEGLAPRQVHPLILSRHVSFVRHFKNMRTHKHQIRGRNMLQNCLKSIKLPHLVPHGSWHMDGSILLATVWSR